MAGLSDAKRAIVDHLKRHDEVPAADLAARLSVTVEAVRQHLDALESAGLVMRSARPNGRRGRPAARWSLTPLARELFPDRHAELTVDLLESVRATLGDKALRRVIDARSERQAASYAQVVAPGDPVPVRVQRLASLRAAEGYVAEAVDAGDGSVLLVEHHCPVSEAAAACPSLCSAELEVFRTVLGPTVAVSREQHLLAGDRRCVYRVSPAPDA